jgi:hypothetical protein
MLESKIEQELLEVSALKVKKNEDRQKYLERLMRAVSKLPDPDWEGLSKAAQDWNNGAAEAHKGGSELEDFPDYEEVDDEIDEEQAEEETKPIEKAAKKKEEAPAKSYAPRKVSACHTIKKLVAKKPDISVSDLSEKLKGEGFKVSDVTIATLRSDFRDSLRVLNELGVGQFAL